MNKDKNDKLKLIEENMKLRSEIAEHDMAVQQLSMTVDSLLGAAALKYGSKSKDSYKMILDMDVVKHFIPQFSIESKKDLKNNTYSITVKKKGEA